MAATNCVCGEKFHYSDEQAGGSVRCRCGRFLELPAVAVTRRTEREVATSATRPRRRSLRRPEVLAGLAVVIGLVAMAFIIDKTPPRSIRMTSANESIPARRASFFSCEPSDSGGSWRRIPNGTELKGSPGRGLSRLTVENGTSSDAVVELVDDPTNKVKRTVFVSGNDAATISGISQGRYRVDFYKGTTWIPRRNKFCHSQGKFEFDDPLAFEELEETGGVRYRTFRLTLQPVVGGTARTHSLPEQDDTIPG